MFRTLRPIALALTLAGTLSACGSLPGTTTPTATPAQLEGVVTHLGQAPGTALTLGLKRYDGALFQRVGTTVQTETSGQFRFRGLAAGRYQVLYDDQGELVNRADVNTVGAYVDAEVQVVELAAGQTASSSFDVGWNLSPTIKPEDAFRPGSADRFSFGAKYGAPTVEYQLLVADASKSAVWSSAWAMSTSFAWNGQRGSEVAVPTTSYLGLGVHYYQVKFRKAGTSFGGAGGYGQTKWIPFQLVR